MQTSLPISTELNWLTFSHLDSASLQQTSLVCKELNHFINQEAFLKFYAHSRSKIDMTCLLPEFFHKLIPYFDPQQLFHINGKIITRHLIHKLPETENNKVNLRIAKLIASLDWYQEVIQQNIDSWIKQWHFHNPRGAKKFKESREYIHLLLLGDSNLFMCNRMDQRQESDFEEYQDLKFKTKNEFNQVEWHKAAEAVEFIIAMDYVFLKSLNPLILEQCFQAVFSKYKIRRIMNPRGEMKFFRLSTLFFKSFFSVLTSQFLQKNNEKSMTSIEKSSITHNSSGLLGLLNTFKQFFSISKTNVSESIDSGFKSLQITIYNDEELDSFIQWLEKTKVQIDFLELDIGWGGTKDITIKGLQSFKNKIEQFNINIKRIEFFGGFPNPDIDNLYHEICDLLNQRQISGEPSRLSLY